MIGHFTDKLHGNLQNVTHGYFGRSSRNYTLYILLSKERIRGARWLMTRLLGLKPTGFNCSIVTVQSIRIGSKDTTHGPKFPFPFEEIGSAKGRIQSVVTMTMMMILKRYGESKLLYYLSPGSTALFLRNSLMYWKEIRFSLWFNLDWLSDPILAQTGTNAVWMG